MFVIPRQGKFLVSATAPDGRQLDGGAWDDEDDAAKFGEMLVRDDVGKRLTSSSGDLLAEHRGKYSALVVTYDQVDRKYSVVGKHKKGFEDTGARFNSWREAMVAAHGPGDYRKKDYGQLA